VIIPIITSFLDAVITKRRLANENLIKNDDAKFVLLSPRCSKSYLVREISEECIVKLVVQDRSVRAYKSRTTSGSWTVQLDSCIDKLPLTLTASNRLQCLKGILSAPAEDELASN